MVLSVRQRTKGRDARDLKPRSMKRSIWGLTLRRMTCFRVRDREEDIWMKDDIGLGKKKLG